MTSPVPLGTPDYARLAPFSDEVFANTTGGPVTGPTVLFQQYVGNIRALWWSVSLTGDDGQLIMNWFTDKAFSVPLGSQVVDLSNGFNMEHTMTPFAPYLRMVMQSNSGAAYTYGALISSTSQAPIPWTSSGQNEIIQNTGFVIPANSQQLFTGSPSWIGMLYWNAWCDTGNWQAALQRTNRFGAAKVIDLIDQSCVKGVMRQVPFIGGTPQVNVINNNAAPNTARVFVLGGHQY